MRHRPVAWAIMFTHAGPAPTSPVAAPQAHRPAESQDSNTPHATPHAPHAEVEKGVSHPAALVQSRKPASQPVTMQSPPAQEPDACGSVHAPARGLDWHAPATQVFAVQSLPSLQSRAVPEHLPSARQTSPVVHGSRSSQVLPAVTTCTHPPRPQESAVQGSSSSQPAATQAPPQHSSAAVHTDVRRQLEPSQRASWQAPAVGVQVAAVQIGYWQSSAASQWPPAVALQSASRGVWTQPLAAQESAVQATRSSQVGGVPARQDPASQRSRPLHGSPSSQSPTQPGPASTSRPASTRSASTGAVLASGSSLRGRQPSRASHQCPSRHAMSIGSQAHVLSGRHAACAQSARGSPQPPTFSQQAPGQPSRSSSCPHAMA